MNTKARLGIVAGVTSILFSILCFIVLPVFSAAIIVAPLIGVPVGAVAIALGARRTGGVTCAFSLVPLSGLLVMESSLSDYMIGYVAFAPLVFAIALAVWAAANYSRTKRTSSAEAALR